MSNNHLLLIDPQNDFMKGGALAVDGATRDMQNVARLLTAIGGDISDIHVTLDTHHLLDVAHPAMWIDANGDLPAPFTIITHDDIRMGRYMPRDESLLHYMLDYTRMLEKQGNYPLTIWPEHCLIGTPGHAVQEDLRQALASWERDLIKHVNYVNKGENPFTEHYGAFEAEVPLDDDPYTQLNEDLLEQLRAADNVLVAGEALSHCVKATVEQIAANIGDEHLHKFILLEDCMSPVAQLPGGPDFPAIGEQFLRDMQSLGMQVASYRSMW